jgi:hypothetical protein
MNDVDPMKKLKLRIPTIAISTRRSHDGNCTAVRIINAALILREAGRVAHMCFVVELCIYVARCTQQRLKSL